MKKTKEKKHGILWAIMISISLFLLNGIIYAFVYVFTNNIANSYFIAYALPLIVLFLINKEELIKDFKNLKTDIDKKKLKLMLMYFLFIGLMMISNLVLYNISGNISQNEESVREILFSSPILMFISFGFLGPIYEEMTFRFPYKNIKTNKTLKFIIYTLIFASIHIIGSTELLNLLFIIPYIFLSLALGYSYYKTNNIYTSMFFHILNNSFTLLIVLLEHFIGV